MSADSAPPDHSTSKADAEQTRLEKLRHHISEIRTRSNEISKSTSEHLPEWIAKSRTTLNKLSQACNAKLLFGLKKLEETTDPAENFMADSHSRHVKGASVMAHVTLWACVLFLVLFLIWANFAVLDEVTVGEGKVIPASQVQVIQNLEGGIVKQILVHEGQIVQKGEVLMLLDDTRFASDYQETQTKEIALEAKIARLSAVIDNKAFSIAPQLQTRAPDLVKHEYELYKSQMNEELQLRQTYLLNKKELDLTQPLVTKGAASDVEVLRLERQVADAQGQIDAFLSRTLQDLNTAKADLLSLNASLGQYQDRLKRTTIRSPVKGIVKQIKITTVGGVSQPGMDLMEVVPLEDTLLVEAQIKPKDIGFIHVGQEAMVKISAYDFSIYGGLKGKVEEISADSLNTVSPTNPKGESYYLVRVRTHQNYLESKKGPLFIIPGMMASVDILTGRKSVLDYLLKPIIKAKQNALRER